MSWSVASGLSSSCLSLFIFGMLITTGHDIKYWPGAACCLSPQPVLRPSHRTPGQSTGHGDCPHVQPACRFFPFLPLRVLLCSLCPLPSSPCPRPLSGGEAPGLRPHIACPVSTPARPLPAPVFMEHFPRAKLCSEEHPRAEWQRQDLNPGMLAQGQTISAPRLSPSGIRGQAQAGTFRCWPPASRVSGGHFRHSC